VTKIDFNSRKVKIGIVSVALLTSFAVGRYTVSEKIVTVTKTVEVAKKDDDKVVDNKKKTHTTTTTTTAEKPDGSKVTTVATTTDINSDIKVNDKIDSTTSTESDAKSTISKGLSQLTLSAMGGYDFRLNSLVYGVSLTKPVLGPIGIGIWALSQPSVGASLNLTF